MNQRLKKTIETHLTEIEDGTYLDCYDTLIYKDICCCITTRTIPSNNYFVAVKDKNEINKDKNSQQ